MRKDLGNVLEQHLRGFFLSQSLILQLLNPRKVGGRGKVLGIPDGGNDMARALEALRWAWEKNISLFSI